MGQIEILLNNHIFHTLKILDMIKYFKKMKSKKKYFLMPNKNLKFQV